MSKPDWTEAPTEATHWDTQGDVFCNTDGWWNAELFYRDKFQEDWGTDRYTPRPTESAPSDWAGGWPPVGWQGECAWQNKAEWFNCVVIPDGNVAVQGYSGSWNVINDLKEHDFEFREVQSEEDATANSKEWDGTGFPPVGTECEVEDVDHGWILAIVMAHDNIDDVAVCKTFYGYDGYSNFLPIRPKSQSERADLLQIITKQQIIGSTTQRIVDCIIEKGYRRVKD